MGRRKKVNLPIIVYVDGCCEPVNPGGTAAYGYVIYHNGQRVADGYGVVGSGPGMTNNVAEYRAAIAALTRLVEIGLVDKVEVRSDSQLLVNQMCGYYRVKSPRLQPLYHQLSALVTVFPAVRWRWVPREQNEEADRFSKQAADAGNSST